MVIGYTTGVFDLFHIGHLNLLKNAKGMCDRLVVGVTVDELVQYKGKNALIPFEDRIEIVRSCKYVDAAIPQYDMDKLKVCKALKASVLFVGDDWYGTDKWKQYEEEFEKEGIKIVYFPYTRGVSSTQITNTLRQVRGWTTHESDVAFYPVVSDEDENGGVNND
jgi:glycerol-3-phosphate cytidylyltransferase